MATLKKLLCSIFFCVTCAISHEYTFLITAHNAADFCEKTLSSIFSQTYQDFNVIYIDDGSTDKTSEKVKQIIKNHHQQDRVALKTFTKNKGLIERAYETIHRLPDRTKIVFLNGYSWLCDNDALKKIDQTYKKTDAFFVYAQHKEVKTNKKGKKRYKKGKNRYINSINLFSNSMRARAWHHPRLKSFYAALFKKVPLKEFFFRGKFIDEKFEQAYIFPMMEMAEKHVDFISDVLCIFSKKKADYSRPCRRSRIKALRNITSADCYAPISNEALFQSKKVHKRTDILIFSYDRPMQLRALLESTYKYYKNVHRIFVLYRTSHSRFSQAYLKVKKQFPHVYFLKQSKKPKKDFKPLVLETLYGKVGKECPYIIFAVDDIVVKDHVDLSKCIEAMEQTGSLFFSLRLGKSIDYCYMGSFSQPLPFHITLPNKIMGWHIDAAKGDWMYDSSVDMTLYRKKDLKKTFKTISFSSPNNLEPAWSNHKTYLSKYDKKRVTALSFSSTKALNIPLNLVNISENKNMALFTSQDLLEKFEEGYKINIDPLFKISNKTVHMEYEIELVR